MARLRSLKTVEKIARGNPEEEKTPLMKEIDKACNRTRVCEEANSEDRARV
jgi:hypothetical protein